MKITVRKGVLLPGYVPMRTGTLNAVFAGTAAVDKEEFEVVAKKIPAAEIDIEVFCAVLAVHWELPALPPLVLTDEAGDLFFASARTAKRNLVQVLNLEGLTPAQQLQAARPLAAWTAAPAVSAFDEAIHNVDRNLGNILWTDENDYLLIDHGLCLRDHGNRLDVNVLLQLSILLMQGDDVGMARLKKQTLSAAKKLDEDGLDDAGSALTGAPDTENHLAFVRMRLQSLAALIKARFPNGQLQLISTP